jgi:hypothetical protein
MLDGEIMTRTAHESSNGKFLFSLLKRKSSNVVYFDLALSLAASYLVDGSDVTSDERSDKIGGFRSEDSSISSRIRMNHCTAT